jgi:hypothetical protein
MDSAVVKATAAGTVLQTVVERSVLLRDDSRPAALPVDEALLLVSQVTERRSR